MPQAPQLKTIPRLIDQQKFADHREVECLLSLANLVTVLSHVRCRVASVHDQWSVLNNRLVIKIGVISGDQYGILAAEELGRKRLAVHRWQIKVTHRW